MKGSLMRRYMLLWLTLFLLATTSCAKTADQPPEETDTPLPSPTLVQEQTREARISQNSAATRKSLQPSATVPAPTATSNLSTSHTAGPPAQTPLPTTHQTISPTETVALSPTITAGDPQTTAPVSITTTATATATITPTNDAIRLETEGPADTQTISETHPTTPRPAIYPADPMPTSPDSQVPLTTTTVVSPLQEHTMVVAPVAAGNPQAANDSGSGAGWQNQPQPDEMHQLQTAQRMPHDRVMLARAIGGKPDVHEIARTFPRSVNMGDVETFWVSNLAKDENYEVQAELRYVGPVVLMYVEQGVSIDQTILEETARTFEQDIYPFTRYLFGSEWRPGVDGDHRITILNVESHGDSAIGYFSSRDSTPREVNRYSNEREMFYMKIKPGNPNYLPTLAHEFQHMIHWNEQRGAATWFQEGCAKLSEDLNDYGNDSFVGIYLRNPDTQLNAWPQSSSASHAHYGASNLFMRYIYAQYAGQEGLSNLIRQDASNNLDAFVALAATRRPDITRFTTIFGDWLVANLVNDLTVADGRYTYDLQQGMRRPPGGLTLLSSKVTTRGVELGEFRDTVAQFGADYLTLPPGPITVNFTGSLTVSLIGARPHENYAWWSGRGDNSMATLTRAFDLRDLVTATLRFDTWYEMETDYDYAFVSVSTDGGQTWETLKGNHTTEADPQGANYGYGLTGVSGAPQAKAGANMRGTWVEEEMDLTPYTGGNILLRFWQVNDEAYHAPGLLLDNVRICKGRGEDACLFQDNVEAGAGDWQAEGFVRVDGVLPQKWELRLVRSNQQGITSVDSLPVDENGSVSMSIPANEDAVLIIAGTTPHTTEPARYRLMVRKDG